MKILIISLTAVSFWSGSPADEVKKGNSMLCSIVQATRCTIDGDCQTGPPWRWNIPQFIEVDLIERTLSITRASGENRTTAIKNLERQDGQIFLQGVQMERAYTIAIAEETGAASFVVATEGLTVGAFGACTPVSLKR